MPRKRPPAIDRSDISTHDHGGGGGARWTAYYKSAGWPVGYGSTKDAAIADLKSKLRARPPEPTEDRLFIGTFPTGISYADRKRERHGDYMKIAFLPFRTLELEWYPDALEKLPQHVKHDIEKHAKRLQARRGESYQVSQSGQTVTLGK